ncbi:MAG: YbbR-like domain-containing protein [Gemmatimonadota bacterium]|nr:YbbR-like domain-containing protein [Gemmatimonadota bacterium]
MDWRRAVFANWGYKLAALAVVSLLWLNLTADERQTQSVATRLEVEVLDSAWVLVEDPGEILTTFQGRNRELLGLLLEEPQVAVVIDSVPGPAMQIELDAEDVRYDRDLEVRPTAVIPRVLTLRFEPVEERRVPVVADIEAEPASGFTVLRPVILSPDSVTIRGPASEVGKVSRVTTAPSRLTELSHPVVRDLPVVLPSGLNATGVRPSSVLLTVEVDSLVIRRRTVPVRVAGSGAGGLVAEPDSAEVVLRGAASTVLRFAAGLDRVVAEVGARPDGPLTVPLRVPGEPGGFVSVSVIPPEASVRPGRGR